MRFPARAERCPQDPCHPHQQRPAPDPAGETRPPVAGRALAGGFGPPAGLGSAKRCGRGDGPCHWSGERAFIGTGGNRKRTAFPRPRGMLPPRPVQPAQQEASARPGGRDAPAAGGAGAGRGLWAPGWPRISVALLQGRWPLPWQRRWQFGFRSSAPSSGGGNALRFPRPRGTLPQRPVPPAPTEASARPGGREAPARGGAGAGRGLWAPGGPGISVALWQGRWPLPE
jgi:hypothetical protein